MPSHRPETESRADSHEGLPAPATLKVLVLTDSQPLLHAVEKTLGRVPGAGLAGAFRSAQALSDWLLWEGAEWHIALVDFAARVEIAPRFVEALVRGGRPSGQVVVLGDPDWSEMVLACTNIGADRVIKRGDLEALRVLLESHPACTGEAVAVAARPAQRQAEPAAQPA